MSPEKADIRSRIGSWTSQLAVRLHHRWDCVALRGKFLSVVTWEGLLTEGTALAGVMYHVGEGWATW